MQPLAPIVASAAPGAVIDLAPGEYDDAEPVRVAMPVTLRGPREAVIHSEFAVTETRLGLDGVTMQMNKQGGPTLTGCYWDPSPQNGMVTVFGGHFVADDVEWLCAPGIWDKSAIWADHAKIDLRGRDRFARILWTDNAAPALRVFYNSLVNIFGQFRDAEALCSVSGAALNVIELCTSRLVLSGGYINNLGGAACGVNAFRNSFVQIGTGTHAPGERFHSGFGQMPGPDGRPTQFTFPDSILCDATSWSFVHPGNWW